MNKDNKNIKINFWVDSKLKKDFDKYLKKSEYDNKSNFFRILMKKYIKEEIKKEKLDNFYNF